MTYYPTLDDDLARAKGILAAGKPDEASLRGLPATIRNELGGTIYGGDIYAAYKLLESFVAEIERLRAGQARPDTPVRCAHCEHAIAHCPACGKAEWRIDTRAALDTTSDAALRRISETGKP